MTTFILTLMIGLSQIFAIGTLSHADPLMPSPAVPVASHQAQLQTISHSPTNGTIVGIVPASAFPSCQDAIGGVLYVTRASHSSALVEHSDELLDGPSCGTSLAANSADTAAGEPLLVVPMTAEGTLSDRPCRVITTPQRHCEIPPGSLLSAFPLA
jgi:hypothetical protein